MTVAFGTVWIKHFLDNKKKNIDEENYERISQQDIDSMLEVQEFLESFRVKWNLDRVGIFQFHNKRNTIQFRFYLDNLLKL